MGAGQTHGEDLIRHLLAFLRRRGVEGQQIGLRGAAGGAEIAHLQAGREGTGLQVASGGQVGDAAIALGGQVAFGQGIVLRLLDRGIVGVVDALQGGSEVVERRLLQDCHGLGQESGEVGELGWIGEGAAGQGGVQPIVVGGAEPEIVEPGGEAGVVVLQVGIVVAADDIGAGCLDLRLLHPGVEGRDLLLFLGELLLRHRIDVGGAEPDHAGIVAAQRPGPAAMLWPRPEHPAESTTGRATDEAADQGADAGDDAADRSPGHGADPGADGAAELVAADQAVEQHAGAKPGTDATKHRPKRRRATGGEAAGGDRPGDVGTPQRRCQEARGRAGAAKQAAEAGEQAAAADAAAPAGQTGERRRRHRGAEHGVQHRVDHRQLQHLLQHRGDDAAGDVAPVDRGTLAADEGIGDGGADQVEGLARGIGDAVIERLLLLQRIVGAGDLLGLLDQGLLRLAQALGIRRLARGDQATDRPQRRQFPLALLGRLADEGRLGAQIVQLALTGP